MPTRTMLGLTALVWKIIFPAVASPNSTVLVFLSTRIRGADVPTLKRALPLGVEEPTENAPRNEDVAVVEVAWKYSPTTPPTTESLA